MDELFTDLLELLEIPSTGGTAAEAQAQRWVARKLQSWGWEVEVWEDDPARYLEHPGMEVDRSSVVGVIGRPPGSTGENLILGHTDVVPGGPSPAVRGSTVIGRGTADMKAGLVAGMHAARMAPTTAVVCAVSGEEDGGIGAFLALKHGLTAKRCVIPEPTDLSVVLANAGSLTFRITLPGVAAHGARRWEGHNALEMVPEVMTRLRGLEARRNTDVAPVLASWPIAYPISIGRIQGGDWPSTVMAQVQLEGRYGVALDETIDAAIHIFEESLVGTGAAVEWFGGRFAPAGLTVDHPLVTDLARAHHNIVGSEPAVLGATYGSDLRQLIGAGIPTVLYGPGDAQQAHSEDEEVGVEQVLACRDVLAEWLPH